MKLTVLGSGTLIPFPKRGNSGYFLQSGTTNILIDGGSGALRKISDFGLNYLEINGICYSHLHPDHTMDLIPFLFALKHDPRVVNGKLLQIVAPVGFISYFDRLMDIYGEWTLSEDVKLNIEELTKGTAEIGDISFTCDHTEHTQHSITYRFMDSNGKEIFYSGDTDYCKILIDSAKGVDVLILECSFPDQEKKSGHLTPVECGQIAYETQCGRLVLTHLYPDVLNEDIISSIRKSYDGRVDIAFDGMEIII
ncbi:MAG: MBL fold metallo-hydrolase [Fidelibacterota bacterium]